MRVNAVVVHFVDEARTRRCLESLAAQEQVGLHTVLVDHSPEGAAPFPQAGTQIRPESNRGFGAGVRAGMRAAEPAEFILLLNPDAVAEPGWARRMAEALSASERTGMAACRVASGDGRRLDSAGLGLTRGGLGLLRGHGRPLREQAALGRIPLLGPAGSAAAYRTAMLEELGGFPEAYFLYYEDLEVAFRGRRRGWECAWVDEALVRHHHESSAGPSKAYYLRRAQRLFLQRNWPRAWRRRYRAYHWAAQGGAWLRALRRGGVADLRRAHRDAAAMPGAGFQDPDPKADWLAARP